MRNLALLCLFTAAALGAADFKTGLDAYNRGDFAAALADWQPIATAGDPHAQYNLGLLYARGQGVPQDYKQAAEWYQKAAEQGVAAAQYNLGVMYANGQGVPANPQEASKWFLKAAEQGVSDAANGLGRMYYEGEGAFRNYSEAEKWYRKAAEQGVASAAFNLGVMYDLGQGVEKDYAEAQKWYRKAADEGYAGAMANLGILYYNAQGVKRDLVQAYAWFSRAQQHGDPRASELLSAAGNKLKPGDLKKAQTLAAQWQPANANQTQVADARLFKPAPDTQTAATSAPANRPAPVETAAVSRAEANRATQLNSSAATALETQAAPAPNVQTAPAARPSTQTTAAPRENSAAPAAAQASPPPPASQTPAAATQAIPTARGARETAPAPNVQTAPAATPSTQTTAAPRQNSAAPAAAQASPAAPASQSPAAATQGIPPARGARETTPAPNVQTAPAATPSTQATAAPSENSAAPAAAQASPAPPASQTPAVATQGIPPARGARETAPAPNVQTAPAATPSTQTTAAPYENSAAHTSPPASTRENAPVTATAGMRPPASQTPAAATQDIPPAQGARETAPATPREPPVAKADETKQNVWTGAERIVAVGDVHGDYEQFTGVLASAGLIDGNGDWIGGKTHLVQTGDVVDRGPDSRAVMDLLMKLEKQAAAAGGAVHALIGNHEAMNVYGDLRYVSPGEFASYTQGGDAARVVAFADRAALAEAAKPSIVRVAMQQEAPAGYAEHRAAFAPDGIYGRWIRSHEAIIKINRTLFVHGGLGSKYVDWSLDRINDEVHAELNDFTRLHGGIVTDEEGPLWYRDLASGDEQRLAPLVDDLLKHFDVDRIVVGHSYAQAAITPRFGGKVVLIDIGLSRVYDNVGKLGCLEIDGDQAIAIHRGQKLELPKDENGPDMLRYLKEAAALDPQPSPLLRRIEQLQK